MLPLAAFPERLIQPFQFGNLFGSAGFKVMREPYSKALWFVMPAVGRVGVPPGQESWGVIGA